MSKKAAIVQQSHANEQKFSTLVENAEVCIHEIDLQGELISMNPAGLAMLGLKEEHEIVGLDYISLVSLEDKDRINSLLQAAYRGENSEFHFGIQTDEGTLYFSSSFIPLRASSGEIDRIMGVTQDITELKAAQIALEEKIQERTEQLQVIHQQLKNEISGRVQAEEERLQYQQKLSHIARVNSIGAMATGITHELNQPLSSAANYMHGCILKLKRGAVQAEELLPIMEKVDTEVRRAGSIVHRMHDFVRPGISQKEMVQVNSIVTNMVELLKLDAKQKHIDIECELDENLLPIIADRTQLGQVLVNLIRNAIEAIQESNSTPRTVTITTGLLANNVIEVRVCDYAAAVDPGQTQDIFSPFVTTKKEGLGMGLAICRMIVEAHGGTLSVKVEPGETTCFYLHIPVGSG